MANPDLDELLNTLMPFAQQMLAKEGEFFPFGASMSAAGEVACVAADTGEEQPESQPLIDMMVQGFRVQAAAGEIRAAGVCIDVRTIPPGQTEKTDAICIRAEHQSGEALHAYVPYKKGFLGRIKYGELFAAAGTREIFVQQSGTT